MPITGAIPLPETGMDAFLEARRQAVQNRLGNAQASQAEAKAKLPFGGASIPGPAGQIQGLEMLKGIYGENSPQYEEAKKAFNLNQEGIRSRVGYQDILSKSAGKRFSTPMAKTLQELDDIRNGNMPGTKTPLTPEQQQQYEDTYGLDILKKTTDTDTRQRDLFSKNMDITISKINPEALTGYSGIKGGIELIRDKAKSLKGEKVPRYEAYEEAATNAKLLAKQYRQYAKDSITPGVQGDLNFITNPSNWLLHKDVALKKYNSFISTLQAEQGTFRRGLQSPEVYTEQGGQQPQQAPQPSGQQQPPMQPPQQQMEPPPQQGAPGATQPGAQDSGYTPEQLQAFAADTVKQLIAKGKSPEEAQKLVDAEMQKLMGGS